MLASLLSEIFEIIGFLTGGDDRKAKTVSTIDK